MPLHPGEARSESDDRLLAIDAKAAPRVGTHFVEHGKSRQIDRIVDHNNFVACDPRFEETRGRRMRWADDRVDATAHRRRKSTLMKPVARRQRRFEKGTERRSSRQPSQ